MIKLHPTTGRAVEALLEVPSLRRTRGGPLCLPWQLEEATSPGALQEVWRAPEQEAGAHDGSTKMIQSPQLTQLKPWWARLSVLRDLLRHLKRPRSLTRIMTIGHSHAIHSPCCAWQSLSQPDKSGVSGCDWQISKCLRNNCIWLHRP